LCESLFVIYQGVPYTKSNILERLNGMNIYNKCLRFGCALDMYTILSEWSNNGLIFCI